MRGRKPKPTHLKLIAGNSGKRPLNRNEPRPKLQVPTCPSHLCPASKAEWKRLARQLLDLGVVTALDRAAMAVYCQAYGRWAEAERKQKAAPLVIRLPSGVIQQSPFVSIANKQLELMHKFLSELGLSPVARNRVSVQSPRRLAGRQTEQERKWHEFLVEYG
ncbi:MAG TPA: phage terminase small subunit P27 family [Afifellaceae bacterium]|nr:phage terminase small subunit P27 family [Afifellaceae bacterium]